PRLPPTTSTRSGPARSVKRDAGGASATMSSRNGLPTQVARFDCLPRSAFGNPSRMRSAPYASTRVARPATAFASCRISGLPLAMPISAPGNDAKPPKPITTQGRRRRMTRKLSTHARSSAKGPSTSVRMPLPRTPRNDTLSKSTPCAGTSRASMPSRVPSQNTRQPRATSFAATASPGNTWPPVPPVVIITVAFIGGTVNGSYGEPSQHLPVLVIDPQQDRDRDAVGDDAAAAERQQRQRESLRRQHAHVDAHVDERLDAYPHADPVRDKRRERPRQPRRLAADRIRAKQQPRKERDHRYDAGEAELFGDDGEQEIGVGLRQVQQLLDARAKSDAQPLAATERDQRMRQLIALVQGIRPRIEEVRQALHAVRRCDQDRGEGYRQQHREAYKQPPVETAQKKDRERDRENHDECAEIRLEQQQAADQHHHRRERRESAQQCLPQRLLRVQERGLAHRVARGVQHAGELHEFGRLDVDQQQRQPPFRPVDRFADAGNQDEDEQRRAAGEKPRCAALPHFHRHL